LREANSVEQVQRLRDKQADIVFVYQNSSLLEAHDLAVLPLLQEALVVVLSQKHPLATRSIIAVADLAEEEFIMPLHQVVSGLSDQIYSLCTQAGFMPKVAQEAVFTITILGLVAGEMGISILPASVQNLQRSGVVYRPLQEHTTTNQLVAVWRSEDPSMIVRQFIDITKNILIS
jgi:DNA-binding transcriptional LysR family regulator